MMKVEPKDMPTLMEYFKYFKKHGMIITDIHLSKISGIDIIEVFESFEGLIKSGIFSKDSKPYMPGWAEGAYEYTKDLYFEKTNNQMDLF